MTKKPGDSPLSSLTSVPVISRRRRSPSRLGAIPTLTPATGPPGRSTPASSSASEQPDTVAMDDEPFEDVTSLVSRIA